MLQKAVVAIILMVLCACEEAPEPMAPLLDVMDPCDAISDVIDYNEAPHRLAGETLWSKGPQSYGDSVSYDTLAFRKEELWLTKSFAYKDGKLRRIEIKFKVVKPRMKRHVLECIINNSPLKTDRFSLKEYYFQSFPEADIPCEWHILDRSYEFNTAIITVILNPLNSNTF